MAGMGQPDAPGGAGPALNRTIDVNPLGKAVAVSKGNTANAARERARGATEAK